MNNKFEQASALAKQGKYKKALQIVQKINQKTSEMNFATLELEIACLFFEKQYRLAYLKNQNLFTLTNSDEQKLKVLRSLAALSEKLAKPEEAIIHLKRILEIDGSLNTAAQRFALIKLASTTCDFNSVASYGPLLSNMSEYSIETLLLLSQCAINTHKPTEALGYLSRLAAEIRMEGRPSVDQNSLIGLLNGFHIIKAHEKEQELLKFLEPKFKHENWFQQVQLRLKSKGKVVKAETVKSAKGINKKFESNDSPMLPGVRGNTAKTAQIITKLKSALESMGASFHKNLCIVERDGDIMVTLAAASERNELLMDVPIKCIPLVNDYRFSLDENGCLVSKAKKNTLNSDANVIMQLLTQMYNACNKLANWKNTYPLFLLAGFDKVIKKLFEAKSSLAGRASYYSKLLEKITDTAVIESFFSSRTMGFDNALLRKNKIKTKLDNEQGFIPIVELINHKMGVNPFNIDNKTASLKTSTGVGEAGREVFVQYNLDDPLVTLLTYGFVDSSAKWIYTVPVVLETKTKLKIHVGNHILSAKVEDIPNHLLGLADYMPADISRQGGIAQVSKLIIPGTEHSHSLRAVLAHVLKYLDSEGFYKDPIRLDSEVAFIEKQLIELNKKYWLELMELVSSQIQSKKPLPPLVAGQLNELCELCLNHIDRYHGQMGHLLQV
jgi:tetratricopeptide (TPR) repeat protein